MSGPLLHRLDGNVRFVFTNCAKSRIGPEHTIVVQIFDECLRRAVGRTEAEGIPLAEHEITEFRAANSYRILQHSVEHGFEVSR